jgi:hypothetical protein
MESERKGDTLLGGEIAANTPGRELNADCLLIEALLTAEHANEADTDAAHEAADVAEAAWLAVTARKMA